MFNKLKLKLRENKSFYFMANLFRYWRMSEFRDLVRGFGGPDVVLVEHPGKLYPEKLVYKIDPAPDGGGGFFATVMGVLNYLYYAEKYNLTPTISWKKSWYYKEEKPVNGTNNIWEYFFLPCSDVKTKDIKKCKNLVFSCPRQGLAIADNKWGAVSYESTTTYISRYSEIYRKYVRLNPTTRKYINENIKNTIRGKYTLGVHVRGTDFKRAFNNHPVVICPDKFIVPAKELLEKHGYEQIFLATDSLEAVEMFRKEFGSMLVCYEDVMRSDGDVGVHVLESKRKNHHYLLGQEVLRDAYTLAVCDSLLAGMSNVSFAAQYIKIAEGEVHEEVKIIDYGINHNNNKVAMDKDVAR